jgi:flagellar hook-associated protein 2
MASGIRMSGLISNMDTESIVEQLMTAQRTKLTKIENKKTKLTWKQDKWKELNTKIYKLYTDQVSKMRLQGSYKTMTATSTNETAVSVTASTSASAGSYNIAVNQLASAQMVTGSKIGTSATVASSTLESLGLSTESTVKINNKDIQVSKSMTISEFVSKCKDAGVNANFDSGRIYLSSKESGENSAFKIEGDSTTLDVLGLGAAATTISAKDSKIVYNGVLYKQATNTLNVNGLTINAKEVTDASVIDDPDPTKNKSLTSLNGSVVTVSKNTKATYDMIKNFVKEYNSILKEMNTLYYADVAKGYEPLTDEEKEAMSDDQIEKWETKIKDSLLRRDSSLGNVINTLKTSMSSSVEINTKKYSLSSFGISTSTDYSEKGLLHIYGDADDSTYADKTDKLMKALEEDPDTVIAAFVGTEEKPGIITNLYNSMNKAMKTTSLSSALTFYNDKEMTKQQTRYSKDISNMEDKLQTMEDAYYKKFTAMETALAKLQESTSALSSLMG